MSLPDNQMYTATIFIKYDNDYMQKFQSSSAISEYTPINYYVMCMYVYVGTHNLQDLSIVNITSNTLCLQFTLVYGTTTHDVHMHLEGYDSQAIQLMTTVDDNVGIECFGDIFPNNWTLLACDGKGTYCNNPAVVLTDINIPLIPKIIIPSLSSKYN